MSNPTDQNAQRELIWKREEELLEQQKDVAALEAMPPPHNDAQQVEAPMDLDVEKQLYGELLAFIDKHRDLATKVESISAADFIEGAEALQRNPGDGETP
jgi:hypothetical protein